MYSTNFISFKKHDFLIIPHLALNKENGVLKKKMKNSELRMEGLRSERMNKVMPEVQFFEESEGKEKLPFLLSSFFLL